ncbi:ArsR family transcriptional regulator, partial [Coleofasciculus sp. LEGE 07092]|nr:ArsR family transcriptional regulator [Coleofasciculus sp. LEGE 07092]
MTQKIVTPERPLVVPPLLAAEIGLAEAIILQQINYWLRKSDHIIDGIKWIWQTFNQWQEQFPFLSMRQIRQGINKLKALGLIQVERKSAKTWYQANWYSICYDNLKALWHRICPPRANASDRSDQIHLHEAIASDQETSSSKEF